MIAEPLTLMISNYMVSAEATSALPNAPVRDDRTRFGVAAKRTRIRLANSLRFVAAKVEAAR